MRYNNLCTKLSGIDYIENIDMNWVLKEKENPEIMYELITNYLLRFNDQRYLAKLDEKSLFQKQSECKQIIEVALKHNPNNNLINKAKKLYLEIV